MPVDPKKVFIVHGRNIRVQNEIIAFLKAVRLLPLRWEDAVMLTENTAPFIGEVLDVAFDNAQAVIVLLTGDDLVKLKDEYVKDDDSSFERELTPQPRPNVLFEAGMAFGKQSGRTILVEIGKLRPFSDIQGRYVIKLNNTPQKRKELIHRLRGAKCDIEVTDNRWLEAGDFSA